MNEKLKIGIVGAGGIVAETLIKLLNRHKYSEIKYLVSETFVGKSVNEIHRSLFEMKDIKFCSYDKTELVKNCDVIFVIKHHGESVNIIKELFDELFLSTNDKQLNNKKLIIDFSADFRFKDINIYKKWYGFTGDFPQYILEDTVYGLCEIYDKKIVTARVIANPGCYPTSAILGIAPLLKNNMIEQGPIIIDSYSGVSGAGVSPKHSDRNLAVNVIDNIFPYDISNHRHLPEIEQEFSYLYGKELKVIFVPHIVGFKYGICTTIFVKLKQVNFNNLVDLYNSFYNGKKFIRIYNENVPRLQDVVGTNYCDIGIKLDGRTNICIITVMIDNIIKGAAGQAIQNMNIAFKLKEETGLLLD
jgi:N-acetyl-gamma-glutamyl-phosphate reductase